jgi:glycosyltransferase involved in cell wall biosynthesis
MNSLKNDATIIAVSKATKNEIIRNLHIPSEKIFVVYEAIEEYFKPQSLHTTKLFKNIYQLPDTFILHVGTNAGYKNIPHALAVFKELLKRNNSLYFVKVGSPWTENQKILITSLGIEKRVIHLGFIPRESLPMIYALAQCLYYPSFIEGFGFPVLEALSSGCPVITSKTPALVEVSGGAGIHVDTNMSGQIIQTINTLITHDTMRNTYRAKGIKRSQYFSREKMADETFRIYQTLSSL